MSLAYIDPSDRPKESGPYPSLRDSRSFSQYLQTVSPPRSPPDHRHEVDAEEDEDGNFDIRADFEGRGPRYSHVYGLWNETVADGRDYLPIDRHIPPTAAERGEIKHTRSESGYTGKDEMVSIPVLGPEWKKAELHDLSRRGQAEVKEEGRRRAWREFNRDQRGMCGVRWLTRRILVLILFVFFAGLAVTLYFVIPRAPSFAFYTNQPFTVNNATIAFSRFPANFSYAGNLQLLADASNSYVPVHFSDIQATVYDLETQKTIATGNYGNHVVQRKVNQPVSLPVQFSYSALNASDPTWLDMYNACGHIWTGTDRPDLKFRLELKMSIVGMVSHTISETQISGVACPFQLPADSV